jgi:hypothetical protein
VNMDPHEDFAFVFPDGRQLHASRETMQNNDKLRTMVHSGVSESRSGVIEVSDASYEVIDYLLRFVASGRSKLPLPTNQAHLVELISVADQYLEPQLVQHVIDVIYGGELTKQTWALRFVCSFVQTTSTIERKCVISEKGCCIACVMVLKALLVGTGKCTGCGSNHNGCVVVTKFHDNARCLSYTPGASYCCLCGQRVPSNRACKTTPFRDFHNIDPLLSLAEFGFEALSMWLKDLPEQRAFEIIAKSGSDELGQCLVKTYIKSLQCSAPLFGMMCRNGFIDTIKECCKTSMLNFVDVRKECGANCHTVLLDLLDVRIGSPVDLLCASFTFGDVGIFDGLQQRNLVESSIVSVAQSVINTLQSRFL